MRDLRIFDRTTRLKPEWGGYLGVVCSTLVIAFADGTDVLPEELFQRLTELPPSAKLVYKTLEYEGTLTQSELVEESMLSSRTVRSATNELEAAGLVTEEVYIPDARKQLYSVQPVSEGMDEG